MRYRVEIFKVHTNLFGYIDDQKLCEGLLKKLNELGNKQYEVISVIQMGVLDKNFVYQIISKRPQDIDE